MSKTTMETNRASKPISILFCLLLLFIFFTHSDARKQVGFVRETKKNNIKAMKHITLLEKMMSQLNLVQPLDYSNTQPDGISSPFTLPPYESLPPLSNPQNTPPICLNPPNTPSNLPPSSSSYPDLSPPPGPITLPNPPDSSSNPNPPITVPNPNPNPPEPSFDPSPPESSSNPNPPVTVPNPPESSSNPNPPVTVPYPPVTIPNPPETFPSPGGSGYAPGPPGPITGPSYGPGPSTPIDSPTPSGGGMVPSPSSGFLPPVVFPPPMAPPAPSVAPTSAYWCVAKPTVPDPIIQEAMNYACGSGADCHSIQPNGPCFKPNTLWAHASYAFNSYWQRTKASGGSCTFGGTGMLVTVDPSFNGCHFDFF